MRRGKLGILLALAAAGCGAGTGASHDAGTASPDSGLDAPMAPDVVVDARPPDAVPDAAAPALPDPLRVGGALTATAYGPAPFLTPAPGLDLGALPAFSAGRELFVADWDVAPGNRTLIDGLGPLYHAPSCLACHPAAGRARSLEPDGAVAPGLLLRLAR